MADPPDVSCNLDVQPGDDQPLDRFFTDHGTYLDLNEPQAQDALIRIYDPDDTEANTVFVSRQRDPQNRGRIRYTVGNVNWIGGECVEGNLQTKLRHGPRLADCRVEETGGEGVAVTLKEGDPGIACGQWSVFYRGEECLGGGVIE